MNNLDDYNLDDDLPFSPIDDENTDKKQKEEDKNGDTVSPESNIDSEEINNFFNPTLTNEELNNKEKVNIVDNTNYVTNAEIDKDLSKEEKIETIGNQPPCGICGSGVLDAVSEMIKYSLIDETGRMFDEEDDDLAFLLASSDDF